MFDKSFTLQLVTQVIKNDLIPNLTSNVAKEQAIAMISVLKNVDLNTVQNLKPYQNVNQLLEEELTKILRQMEEDEAVKACGLLNKTTEYKRRLQKLQSEHEIQAKWEKLNQLLSELITSVYERVDHLNGYIDILRKLIRKQLNIEIQLVS